MEQKNDKEIARIKFVTCPKCKNRAKGKNQIEEKFGYRLGNKKYVPQSYCRNCRKEQKTVIPAKQRLIDHVEREIETLQQEKDNLLLKKDDLNLKVDFIEKKISFNKQFLKDCGVEE